MRILCTGDVHIGRRPTRLPPGVDARRLSAAVAWEEVVQAACERQVDAVALTGDVVDRDNRFFEAFGPLERGIRRLADRGIEVFAVAGNHDFDVLPRLAAAVDHASFHLLGRGGAWESFTWVRDGVPVLRIDGWSFPAEHVRRDPLADYSPPPLGEVPVLGLLHTDLDAAGSPYAPTRLADLRALPVTAWLVGHVHTPRWIDRGAGAAVLNPGSPQPLDPGETGRHAAWLLSLEGARSCSATPLAVARVRYDAVEVDLTGVAEREEVERAVVEAVTAHLEQAAEDAGPLSLVSLRVVLVGATALHGVLGAWTEALQDLAPSRGTVRASVERVLDRTRAVVDLRDLARGADPVGHLATLLLALEQPQLPDDAAALVARVRRGWADVERARPYTALREDPAGGEEDREIREVLSRQGHRLLERLLQQRRGTP